MQLSCRVKPIWLAAAFLALFAVQPAGAQGLSGQNARQPSALNGDRFLDVIVVLERDLAPGEAAANRARAAEVARGYGVSPRFTYGTALYGFAARIPEGRLTALEHDPRVAYVDFDAPVSIPRPPRAAAPPWCTPDTDHPACKGEEEEEPPPPSGEEVVPWGIERIGADTNTNEGAGVHVYVLDTGIDSDHPDLNVGAGHAVETCKGNDRVCREPWDDDNGHGTHVSGTIGAIDNDIGVLGVAAAVTLHAVKVLAKNGMGSRSGVIMGVDWVAAQTAGLGKPTVANMSLGGSGSKKGTCHDGLFDSDYFEGSDSYHEAICNARHAGVVFAVAAGNDGADAENAVPAAYDDAVITASATEQGDDWPWWSNWGDEAASWTSHDSTPVAIAAPGVDVLSTCNDGGTCTKSGTSMASPHVAGAAALYLESSGPSADGTAFINARQELLFRDESTDTFSNTSGRLHEEDFLDAGSL